MTPLELAEGYVNMKKEYYKFGNIFKRLPGNIRHPLIYFALSMGFRVGARIDERRYNKSLGDLITYNKTPIIGESI